MFGSVDRYFQSATGTSVWTPMMAKSVTHRTASSNKELSDPNVNFWESPSYNSGVTHFQPTISEYCPEAAYMYKMKIWLIRTWVNNTVSRKGEVKNIQKKTDREWTVKGNKM